ncbi:MAG TPA: 2-amino-4-hydroxy-6-hydroxymethyldihydropteridine diphosphokinase [Blastocatellia bacterium]|nr:2-amino-4-hydroxy-6-hydroxymethyldihydropteridine diphosphokinase [Blastocatellia bacterium]
MTTREADCEDRSDKRDDPRAATVYLALGANLGDREASLREGLERIAALGLRITRCSSIYETEPVGFADQGWFLNQVVEAQLRHNDKPDAEAALAEQAVLLLDALLRIESEMGRRRVTANGPRVIDIDILLCDAIAGVFGHAPLPELILPHPRMHLRRFVLAPLCEIAPDVVHPVLRKRCRELLAALDDPAAVRLYERSEP